MAAPALPCDSCGSPISDSDLETGAAITLLGRRYCAGCKTEAIQSISLDDLGAKAASAGPPPRAAAPKAPAKPAAPPPPKPAPRPAAPAPAPAPLRAERPAAAPRRPAPAGRKAARPPLQLAAAAVVLAALAVAAVLLWKGPSRPPADPRDTGKGTTEGPASATTPQDREAAARAAFAKVDELSRRSGTSWDLVLAAAEKAKPACRGTEWEKKLEEIRIRAKQEKEAEEASRDLTPMIDELRGAVSTDPEFKRFAELQPKFQLALETAGKTGSVKMAEIRALQKDYNGRYEKLAEPYYNEINEAANQLADERRYDDALRKIATFPPQLRHSGAWITLDKLRQDIERRKKQAPPKK